MLSLVKRKRLRLEANNSFGKWRLLDRTRIERRRVDGELERQLVVAGRVAAVTIIFYHVFRIDSLLDDVDEVNRQSRHGYS